MDLLERDAEVDVIRGLLDDARSSHGRMLLIEGPPGIGKTRLVETALGAARGSGMRVRSARASELDRYFPFGVVRQLLEPMVAGAGAPHAAWLRGPAQRVPALFDVHGAEEPDADPIAHFHALYWLVANIAEDESLVLAADDVQWADPSSLRFLQFLLPRLGELPVLFVIACRGVEPGADRAAIDALATDPLSVVLRPAPLSDAAVRRLIDSELGPGADGAFSAACRSVSGGNPFLLRELLHGLAAEHIEPQAACAGVVRQIAPPTVGRAVLLRLARLGAEAAALARAVALLGDDVPLQRAAALADVPAARAEQAARELADVAILGPGRPLAFAHPMLRAAVYGDMDAAARMRAHARAADLLARDGARIDEIAVHLLQTEPAGDSSVVEALSAAASHARSTGSPVVAAECLRRALAEPPVPEERAGVLVALASAELHAGEPSRAADHFAQALGGDADPRMRAKYARDWAIALQALDRHDEAFAVRERAIREIAPIDGELASTLEAGVVASAGLRRSRLRWARERLEHRRPLEAEGPAASRLVAMRAYFDAFYGTSSADEAAKSAERALATGALVEAADRLPTTPFFAAVEVLALAERVEVARQALDRALEEAGRRGSELVFACVSGWRCGVLARVGLLREAEADARACAELALRQGGFSFAPPMLGYVMSVLIDCGALEDALGILEQSGMAARSGAEDLSLYPMLHARGRLRAQRRDVDGARTDFEVLASRGARWNTDLTLVPPVLAAPELRGFPFDPDAMLREAREWGTPRAVGMALHAAGRLPDAVAILAPTPARLEYAHALMDLGAQLRRSNRRVAAREPLRQALDVADGCGAVPLAERARQELRAAGGRPRRPRVSGADALTASERRVAGMAADGLSNPEIAQALFVTRKTIEAHLANAYRKLDIRSRAELPSALGADEG